MASEPSAKQAELALRRAKVVAMRVERVPFSQIAAELEISDTSARTDWKRALTEAGSELSKAAHLTRQAEIAALDAMEAAAWGVLRRSHVMVQHGHVVRRQTGWERDPDSGRIERDGEGEPIGIYEDLEDDAPVLAAIDRLRRLGEDRQAVRGRASDAVEKAVRRQLEGMPGDVREGPLAHSALVLAAEIDAGVRARDAAAVVRELRMVMMRLEDRTPAAGQGDFVDELADRRAARAAASG